MKFIIAGRLSSLNEYIRACRSNVHEANALKKTNQKSVRIALKQANILPLSIYPIALKITWYEPNKRRDIDNITFAVKFILDAMVDMKILINDSQRFVTKIEHEVLVDGNKPRIEVEICTTEF